MAATRKAISGNTIVIAGSAPSFPHGIIDPIEELSELARANGVGFHTDACLGGFVLPWAKRLGYNIPPFDFRLPGVTSLSADTHKYGYAPKGTSVILYRGRELRRYQYFKATEWPGGLYFSPTLAGSRPGALSAACWAACVHICVTLRHTLAGIAQRFVDDLKSSAAYVRENPQEKGAMAPVYGVAATIPDRGMVADLLDMYIDLLYEV